MGITSDDSVNVPKSTGAVEYQPPESPPPIEGDPAKSTGAVKYQGPGGEVKNPDAENGGQAEVRFETPTEPVTMTSGWLSESQAKVVTKEHQEAARQSVEPKKTAAAETPEDDVKAERKAAGDVEDPAAVERPGGDDLPAGEPSAPNADETPADDGDEIPVDDDDKPKGRRARPKNIGEAKPAGE